jgi:predicted phosphodiesterase
MNPSSSASQLDGDLSVDGHAHMEQSVKSNTHLVLSTGSWSAGRSEIRWATYNVLGGGSLREFVRASRQSRPQRHSCGIYVH